MNPNVLGLHRRELRGTDSNSLLRLYDRANGILRQPGSPRERARAVKAVGWIVEELRKRNVPF